MVWGVVIAWVAAFAISYALQSNQVKQPKVQPAQFKGPTIETGRSIQVLRGRAWIKAAHIAWYGNTDTVAIRKSGEKK